MEKRLRQSEMDFLKAHPNALKKPEKAYQKATGQRMRDIEKCSRGSGLWAVFGAPGKSWHCKECR